MTNHEALMRRAMHMASTARLHARPNPWVGAVLVCADGSVFEGATQPPGGPHAEIVALNAARAAHTSTEGATLYCTLEPCSHTGRTGPCTSAIIDAGVVTVVSAITDPDPLVAGQGHQALRAAGVEVIEHVCADEVSEQLAPYLHHRTTGRPYVLLKMAGTLDARSSLPHGPRWITGEAARTRVHQIRAESDAIVVGANTVRIDNPELTVRHVDGPSPQRIVLSQSGNIPSTALVHPCTVWNGEISDLLTTLGEQGIVQLMVEGGPQVASEFHSQDLVNRYVFHIAPIISGDESAPGLFSETAQLSLEKCTLVSATAFGDDIEIVMDTHKKKVGVS